MSNLETSPSREETPRCNLDTWRCPILVDGVLVPWNSQVQCEKEAALAEIEEKIKNLEDEINGLNQAMKAVSQDTLSCVLFPDVLGEEKEHPMAEMTELSAKIFDLYRAMIALVKTKNEIRRY